MAFCIPKFAVDKFIKSLPEDSNKLISMTSAERRSFLETTLGQENARQANALFESKLLLKNQQQGLQNWVNKVAGLSENSKRDMLSKIERLDKALTEANIDTFLEDMVEQKLGLGVTQSEVAKMTDLSKKVNEAKLKVLEDSPVRSIERIEYGNALTEFKNYVSDLKTEAVKPKLKDYLTRPGQALVNVAGITKSLLSSLDNSFFGRQGIKVLYTNPDIWAKNFLKSFKDIGRELAGKDAIDVIKSDIYSRPNAINGLYTKAKLAIGITSEEAYPSSLPGRIPILGRLFKASEAAYNGAALRMRADLADRVFTLAKDNQVNLNSKMEIESLGKMVNSLTGRGSLGKAEPISQEINALMFSGRFLKANFDTLTAHIFDNKVGSYTKKQAAINLAKMVGSVASIITVANTLHHGSVELDPRSSDFGKIKIGNIKIDISGGVSSMITLASRIVPTLNNGKVDFYYKNSKGQKKSLTTGDYGALNALDVFESFFEGKLSPVAGTLRDVWKGQNYQGEKPTPNSVFKNLITPLPIKNTMEVLNSKDSDKILLSAILDGLGFSVTIKR